MGYMGCPSGATINYIYLTNNCWNFYETYITKTYIPDILQGPSVFLKCS